MAAAPNISNQNLNLSNFYGAAIGRIYLPIAVQLADLTGTNKIIDAYVPGFAGRIAAVDFWCVKVPTTSGKTVTITPTIGSVAVTGGVLVIAATYPTAGAKVAGTAITALNSFLSTDSITLTLSSVTAFVEGDGTILLTLINDDLRNALSAALGGLRNPDGATL